MKLQPEDDVNAPVSEIWKKAQGSHGLRFPPPHSAVVLVLDESVGGALVVDRKIHVRGREIGHLAVQIGHLTVDYPRRWVRAARLADAEAGLRGFGDPCACAGAAGVPPRDDDRGYGHVDALATPARIAGELGIGPGDFARAAQEPAGPDGRPTRTGEVFGAAGQALGRGIDVMLTIADPVSALLLLPPALARPTMGSAAAEYARAVERVLNRGCFSSSGRPALLVESTGPYPFAGRGLRDRRARQLPCTPAARRRVQWPTPPGPHGLTATPGQPGHRPGPVGRPHHQASRMATSRD
jgi:hypothetical protein